MIPGVDEDELILTGANDIEVEQVTEVLLARYSQRDLWSQPTITMELQSYVTQLIYHGEVFVRLHLDRAGRKEPYSLFAMDWLAPETMLRRREASEVLVRAVRQPARVQGQQLRDGWRATGSTSPSSMSKKFCICVGSCRSPAAHAPQRLRRYEQAVTSGVTPSEWSSWRRPARKPEETFLSLARARAGAFSDALETEQIGSAKVKDMLSYPARMRHPSFPGSSTRPTASLPTAPFDHE